MHRSVAANLYLMVYRTSWLALAIAASAMTPAGAQPTSPPESEPPRVISLEDVHVTATRVSRDGYEAPTPTTVIDTAELDAASPINIADFVNDLPSLSKSSTPRSSNANGGAAAGANLLNLRGLGSGRALILLDGRRVTPTTTSGNVNINLLPNALVERIEIVTGGASAAWGSDAVAGVVNFMLNREFSGVRGSVQGGVSDQGDGNEVGVELAFGTPFADGLGHLLVNAEWRDIGRVGNAGERDWYNGEKVIANPAFTPGSTVPARIVLPNVGLASATDGGVITAGPLRGTQFGPGGAPLPFNFGFVSGLQSYGGDAVDTGGRIHLQHPVENRAVFARTRFDITPAFSVFADVMYAHSEVFFLGVPFHRFGNIVIRRDNAYLDAGIRSTMTTLGLNTFTMGRTNWDLGPVVYHNTNEMWSYTIGAEGAFGDGWTWDAYYQYGEVDSLSIGANNPIRSRYEAAIDAVVNPANSAIVCRSTLTNPTNGCVPMNIFGYGSPSPASVLWVQGASVQPILYRQKVGAVSVRGQPWSLWAGPVSVAAGIDYREEDYRSGADPLAMANDLWLGGFQPSNGGYDVKEVFIETVFPLLADVPLVHALDMNGAVRWTDYSTSGQITTWKVGLTYAINEQLRLRGTRSLDIRAPNLIELFNEGGTGQSPFFDPTTGTTYSSQTLNLGNPDLQPEEADTVSFGVIYQPSWLKGLSASVDYFDIEINGAVSTLSGQATINRCFAGETTLCDSIIRDPISGLITRVLVQPENIDLEQTSGFDVELGYRADLAGFSNTLKGELGLRLLATHVSEMKVKAGTAVFDYAGSLADGTAVPDWRGLLSARYTHDPYSVGLTGRYIGAGVLRNEWGPADIVENHVPSITYLDLSASYNLDAFGASSRLYLVVENLTDKDPPVAPITVGQQHINTGRNLLLYDTIGRMYRLGVDFRF